MPKNFMAQCTDCDPRSISELVHHHEAIILNKGIWIFLLFQYDRARDPEA